MSRRNRRCSYNWHCCDLLSKIEYSRHLTVSGSEAKCLSSGKHYSVKLRHVGLLAMTFLPAKGTAHSMPEAECPSWMENDLVGHPPPNPQQQPLMTTRSLISSGSIHKLVELILLRRSQGETVARLHEINCYEICFDRDSIGKSFVHWRALVYLILLDFMRDTGENGLRALMEKSITDVINHGLFYSVIIILRRWLGTGHEIA